MTILHALFPHWIGTAIELPEWLLTCSTNTLNELRPWYNRRDTEKEALFRITLAVFSELRKPLSLSDFEGDDRLFEGWSKNQFYDSTQLGYSYEAGGASLSFHDTGKAVLNTSWNMTPTGTYNVRCLNDLIRECQRHNIPLQSMFKDRKNTGESEVNQVK